MINKIKEYKNIILDIIKLSVPILGGNVSQILIGFIDTIAAGRYSTQALGAISVASAIVMTFTIGAIGIILSISPAISNMRGQKLPSKRYFKLTILFSLLISIPFFVLLEIFLSNLDRIGISFEIKDMVKEYIAICAWSIFPAVLFSAIKEFLQAWEKVVFANILMIFMVVLNAVLNFVLVFGLDFSFIHISSLGVRGIALATLISKTLSGIIIFLYVIPLLKAPFQYSKKYIKDLFKIGLPISFAIFFEFLGFNLSAVLIGKFSALFAAVHNIILCIANFTFMIVLSVANAASIKIGFYNGRNDKKSIKKYTISSIIISMSVCLITFIILIFFSDGVIKIFSGDIEVINLSKKILKIAVAFLFFDGMQGTCVGILKGLKDTKIIMATMLFAYLVIALPFGSYLAFYKNIVLEGYWLGFALALFFASVVTLSRVVFDIKKMKEIGHEF